MHPRPGIVVPVLLIAILVSSLYALPTTHLEDFSTTALKDTTNTTAWWDTVATELKLFPFKPSLEGSFDTAGNSYGLDVAGDFAIVTNNTSDASIIDITNTSAPSEIGTLNTTDAARDVTIAGNLAYVADGYSGLQIYDITMLTGAHDAIGTFDTAGFAIDVAVQGQYAYVADPQSGLAVIDVSDPTNPVLAAIYPTPGKAAQGVALAGDLAFVAAATYGVQILDVSDPTTPTFLGSYDTPGVADHLAVEGNLVYVADRQSGISIIDVSDPTSPSLVGSYATGGSANAIDVDGDWAFVAAGSQLVALDVSDPSNPSLGFTFSTAGYANGIVVAGDHAFVSVNDKGLQIVRIAKPGPTPRLLDYTYGLDGGAAAVVSGNVLYGAGHSGLVAFDITDPSNISVLGSYDTGWSQGVAVGGDLAVVSDIDSLVLFDVSDPSNPTLLSAVPTAYQSHGVAVDGDFAFQCSGPYVLIYDISDPTAPTVTGTFNCGGYAEKVFVQGDLMYVAVDNWGLRIVDISDPTAPVLLATFWDSQYGRFTLAVSGNIALLGSPFNSGTIYVLDVSDPTSIVQPGGYHVGSPINDIVIDGDYALVCCNTAQLIDISFPYYPTLVSEYSVPNFASAAAIAGDVAFTGSTSVSYLASVKIFDRDFDPTLNEAQSFTIDSTNEDVVRARVNSTEVGPITWELTADGGTNWQAIQNGGGWMPMTYPGSDLRWRATLGMSAGGINTTVSQVQVDYLEPLAHIESIVDVPNDQGGQVRLHVFRSGRDFDGDPIQATAYDVYRRVPNTALARPESSAPRAASSAETRLEGVEYDAAGRIVKAPAATFPPGTWEVVASFGALQQDTYIALAPTLSDSSTTVQYTSYVVVTRTVSPSVWYVSTPDSGYSVDNIAPGVPQGFAVAYNTGSGNSLSWDPAPESDFQYFNVYRGTDPAFAPAPGSLVDATAATQWADPDYDGGGVYYKITAVDHSGNESDPASPGTATAANGPTVPEAFALYQNVPNPFNPVTTIGYDVPTGGGQVVLSVYDASGRLVRTLVHSTGIPGTHRVAWDGTNAHGRRVATGVYFYRLTAPGFSMTRKMVLLK